jgi:hypothetical protein
MSNFNSRKYSGQVIQNLENIDILTEARQLHNKYIGDVCCVKVLVPNFLTNYAQTGNLEEFESRTE